MFGFNAHPENATCDLLHVEGGGGGASVVAQVKHKLLLQVGLSSAIIHAGLGAEATAGWGVWFLASCLRCAALRYAALLLLLLLLLLRSVSPQGQCSAEVSCPRPGL